MVLVFFAFMKYTTKFITTTRLLVTLVLVLPANQLAFRHVCFSLQWLIYLLYSGSLPI